MVYLGKHVLKLTSGRRIASDLPGGKQREESPLAVCRSDCPLPSVRLATRCARQLSSTTRLPPQLQCEASSRCFCRQREKSPLAVCRSHWTLPSVRIT